MRTPGEALGGCCLGTAAGDSGGDVGAVGEGVAGARAYYVFTLVENARLP